MIGLPPLTPPYTGGGEVSLCLRESLRHASPPYTGGAGGGCLI